MFSLPCLLLLCENFLTTIGITGSSKSGGGCLDLGGCISMVYYYHFYIKFGSLWFATFDAHKRDFI